MQELESTDEATLVPELKSRREAFTAIKQSAEVLVAELTNEQFNWKTAPEEWSIGQCLNHLNVTGYLVLRRMEDAIRAAQGRGGPYSGGPFRYGFMSRWFVRFLEPPAHLKVTTPSSYAPSSQVHRDVVGPRFAELQEELIASAGEASGLDLAQIMVASPVTRLLRFPLGAWFAALEAHERRHLDQARRVRAHGAFPE